MKNILYLGLRTPPDTAHVRYTHFPVIAIEPVTTWSVELCHFSHVIFTSRTAVQLLLQKATPKGQTVIAVGRATASELANRGLQASVADPETAEGVVALLATLELHNANILWPHSGQARPVISRYLQTKKVNFTECILYNVVPHCPAFIPQLADYEEILFTSPSTVHAFLQIFPKLPKDKCRAVGPVTAQFLETISKLSYTIPAATQEVLHDI